MGADFCLSVVSAYGNRVYKERKESMLNYLKAMKEKPEDSVEFWDVKHGHMIEDVSLKEMKESMKETINNFFNCLGRRDVTSLNFPEREVILSGGMSWGDAPTDSYDTIYQFGILPSELLNIGGFGDNYSLFDLFMDKYKSKLSKKLIEDLNNWRLLDKI